MSYFFSGWISNLGVVPLFLFAAFLLAPLFLFFLLRILSVCLVFDAIKYLCCKTTNILHFTLFVKIISIQCIAARVASPENLYLAKGEQRIIELKGIEQFSVGNPEVLGRRYSPTKGKLYIKGKKLGFSDLHIWSVKGKLQYNVYVLSKRENLKLAQIAKSLEGQGLNIGLEGKRVLVQGEVTKKETLKRIGIIKQDFQKSIELDITFSKELLKDIVADIYFQFFQAGFNDYKCELVREKAQCFYRGFQKNKSFEQKIMSHWGVPVKYINSSNESGNFSLSFKLIQVELSNGEELSLGLQGLASTVSSFLSKGAVSLYENNIIQANGQEYQLKLVAEPQVITRINKKGNINIGLEIPYQTFQGREQFTTEWKETGLKLGYLFSVENNKLIIDYTSELSTPGESQIKNNKQKSSLYVNQFQKYFKVFHIVIESNEKTHHSPLGLKEVPVLGNLFTSHSHQKIYKLLMGFIEVSPYE